jgi:hypothetical protein
MKTKQRLEEEKLIIQKKLDMAKASKVEKTETLRAVVAAGSDSMFFRGQFDGTHSEMTDKEWVKYMNKKYGFKWTGRD